MRKTVWQPNLSWLCCQPKKYDAARATPALTPLTNVIALQVSRQKI
jgi:hypothetical protein